MVHRPTLSSRPTSRSSHLGAALVGNAVDKIGWDDLETTHGSRDQTERRKLLEAAWDTQRETMQPCDGTGSENRLDAPGRARASS